MRLCNAHTSELALSLADLGLTKWQRVDLRLEPSKWGTENLAFDTREHFESCLMTLQLIARLAYDVAGQAPVAHDVCPVCYLVSTCDCHRKGECGFSKIVPAASAHTLRIATRLGLVASA